MTFSVLEKAEISTELVEIIRQAVMEADQGKIVVIGPR